MQVGLENFGTYILVVVMVFKTMKWVISMLKWHMKKILAMKDLKITTTGIVKPLKIDNNEKRPGIRAFYFV